MNNKILIAACGLLILILFSCKTYLIPVESFKQQFSGIDSTSLKEVKIKGATYKTYLANPIKKYNV